jgi:hypothetical protein
MGEVMKDQNVGDIGDFFKLGLLRFMFKGSDFKLGVNWYLTSPDSRTHGSMTDFKELSECDPQLYALLKDIRHHKRSVESLEQKSVLPQKTIFFRDEIPSGSEMRDQWRHAALKTLKVCPFVFLDPDNGIQARKVVYGTSKGKKYTFNKEIKDYFDLGKSIIVYSHRSREKNRVYSDRFFILQGELGCAMTGLRAKTSPIRDFVFFVQRKHIEFISDSIDKVLEDENWKHQFKGLDLEK